MQGRTGHREFQDFSRWANQQWADGRPFFNLFDNFFFFFFSAAPCLGNYDNSPGPGRETCICSAHSVQLQTEQRGDNWPNGLYLAQWPYERLQRPRSPTHTLPYQPTPSYFIHKNRGLWQFWTAVCFFFSFLHGPLTAYGPRCSCTGCTADTYATVEICNYSCLEPNLQVVII